MKRDNLGYIVINESSYDKAAIRAGEKTIDALALLGIEESKMTGAAIIISLLCTKLRTELFDINTKESEVEDEQ